MYRTKDFRVTRSVELRCHQLNWLLAYKGGGLDGRVEVFWWCIRSKGVDQKVLISIVLESSLPEDLSSRHPFHPCVTSIAACVVLSVERVRGVAKQLPLRIPLHPSPSTCCSPLVFSPLTFTHDVSPKEQAALRAHVVAKSLRAF